MSFKLLIECTKDIDSLKINFSDGTSAVTTSSTPKPDKPVTKSSSRSHTKESEPRRDLLNVDDDYSSIDQEVIRPPEIQRNEKPVNVADEMQNLNF